MTGGGYYLLGGDLVGLVSRDVIFVGCILRFAMNRGLRGGIGLGKFPCVLHEAVHLGGHFEDHVIHVEKLFIHLGELGVNVA